MATHVQRYSSLDLSRPLRSAWPLLALAAGALSFEADPRLPWLLGLAAAVCFLVAAGARGWRAHEELESVRRTADRLIIRAPRTRDASELILWRTEELTDSEGRARLRRELERTIAQLDPARLPSSSPLRRIAARRHEDLLRAIAQRVGDDRPVAARGILLARQLVRDPSSPLYAEDAEQLLARMLSRILGALEL
ncbi:MAG TPA: hypothetical protein VJ814_07500 [Gaiellaceae bacterium]|nr:hypothetical protein [Gaiellaceae bacterium]